MQQPSSPSNGPEIFRIASSDVDQARSFFLDMYYPVAIDVLRDTLDFRLRSDVIRLGPLTVGHIQFAVPVALTASGLDGYHVTVPLAGTLQTRQAGREVAATSDRAAVFARGTPSTLSTLPAASNST